MGYAEQRLEAEIALKEVRTSLTRAATKELRDHGFKMIGGTHINRRWWHNYKRAARYYEYRRNMEVVIVDLDTFSEARYWQMLHQGADQKVVYVYIDGFYSTAAIREYVRNLIGNAPEEK